MPRRLPPSRDIACTPPPPPPPPTSSSFWLLPLPPPAAPSLSVSCSSSHALSLIILPLSKPWPTSDVGDDDVDYDDCDRGDFLIRTKLSIPSSHGTLQQIPPIVFAKPVFLAWPGSWCWRGGASARAVSVTAGTAGVIWAVGSPEWSERRRRSSVPPPSLPPSVRPSVDPFGGGGGASLLASAAVQRTKELKLNRRRKKKQKDRARPSQET